MPEGELGLNSSRFVNTRISLGDINVLPQPRKTFEGLDILAQDIARNGLVYNLFVAQQTEESCVEYLNYINNVRKTEVNVGDLVHKNVGSKRIYYLLIDGETRFRAIKWLRENGCAECVEKHGPGGCNCYSRHFTDNLVDARLATGMSPQEAIRLQYSANIHTKVPPYEEARDLYEFWNVRRRIDPRLSKAEFAREVGRSPQTIRDALKFCLLPDNIQELVTNKRLHYGIACELTRLQESSLPEEELLIWAVRGIIGSQKLAEFRQRVSQYLEERKNGQLSLLDLFDTNYQRQLERRNRRLVVGEKMVRGVHEVARYWKIILDSIGVKLIEADVIPFDHIDDTYSLGSPLRVYRKFVELEAEVLALLRGRLPLHVVKQAEKVILQTQQTLNTTSQN
ncbi:MAG: hypothetical protein Q7S44_04510 [bacterium]|nr:hypothetical protein [bacterium]